MKIAYYSANKLGKSERARRRIAALRATGHEVVVVPPSNRIQGETATFVSYDESWVYERFFAPNHGAVSTDSRPFFCKKYGFRMDENCGECINPDPCYRIDPKGE